LDALRGLGYEKPKVAVLSCLEKVNPKIESTVHAQALSEMAAAGEFGEVDFCGPLSWDLVVSKEAAQIKGVTSSVCGDADLVLVNDINVGNALTKALGFTAKAKGSAITLGAKVPVIMPSRASSVSGKYLSIVVGCAINLQAGGN
jgi:phosphate butyryltransferase